MNQSFDDLPIEIIFGIIISNLSFYIVDYLPLRLVSSRWKYLIDFYFATIKHLVHRNIEREDINNIARVTKVGLKICKHFDRPDPVINYMELFPNLKAVSVDFSNYTKRDQDTLFNYLNTRPTITYLDLFCYCDTKLQNDVKLVNIRNFALNADSILFRDAIKRLFQEDHKFTQLCVITRDRVDLVFEDIILDLKRMPSLKMLTQKFYADEKALDIGADTYRLNFTKQPGLSFENLESYSFFAVNRNVDLLNYVDNFVACCPNLKNIHCVLANDDRLWICELNNLRAHTNVENLAFQGYISYWEIVSKVLEMFPMVKNLKLQDVVVTDHNQLSQALLKLPNLSLLYLKNLHVLTSNYANEVNCEALKKEYNSKYGRNLQIVERNGSFRPEEIPFRHGFNFMENIFWPDWPAKLLTD